MLNAIVFNLYVMSKLCQFFMRAQYVMNLPCVFNPKLVLNSIKHNCTEINLMQYVSETSYY